MKLLEKILFNLGHWCFSHEDYESEMNELKRVLRKRRIEKRGYTEKSDLADFFENPEWGWGEKNQEVRTSGSTGSPVRFWCNASRIASSFALVDYRFKQLGLKKGDVFAKFWYPTTGHSAWQQLKERIWRWRSGERFFSYFDLVNGKKTVSDFLDFILKNRPDFLEGYAGGLISIASYILEHNILLPPIRVVVTGAGMVTPEQHKLIEDAFLCKHYDRYGCSEFGEIAHQLGNGCYEPNPFLEIEVSRGLGFKKFYKLAEALDGEYEIFVTDPRNYPTSFWRYRMQDIVRVKGGKIIQILGRTEKMYEIGPGEFLPTGFLYQAVKDFTNITQWQVEIDTKTRNLILRTLPIALDVEQREVFERYFGKNKFNFLYDESNFATVGRREKIAEIIVK